MTKVKITKILSILIILVFAQQLLRRMIWNEYHSLIMNDGDSVLFYSYVKNLAECPMETSKLLMIDAISKKCEPFLSHHDFTFYSDHPSGFLVILSGLYHLGFTTLSEMRWISVVVSLSIMLIVVLYSRKEKGNYFAFITFVGFLITPLFAFHSFVIHIFTWAELFSVIIGVLFVQEITRPKPLTRYLLFLLLLIGFAIDWPVFILAGVLGGVAILLKRQRLAVTIILISIVSYIFIRYWIAEGINGDRVGIISELRNSLGRREALTSILQIPFYFLKSHLFGVLGVVSFFFFAFKGRDRLRTEPIVLFGSVLMVQGILNVILFLPWAASHIYWTYFLIPSSAIGFALLLENLNFKKIWRNFWVITLVLMSFFYSYSWWGKDYLSKPISLTSYFQSKGIGIDWLSDDSRIYTYEKDIYIGQSAKTRNLITKRFTLLTNSEIPNSGYLVAKSGEKFVQGLGKPVHLEWLEWDVYRLTKGSD